MILYFMDLFGMPFMAGQPTPLPKVIPWEMRV